MDFCGCEVSHQGLQSCSRLTPVQSETRTTPGASSMPRHRAEQRTYVEGLCETDVLVSPRGSVNLSRTQPLNSQICPSLCRGVALVASAEASTSCP